MRQVVCVEEIQTGPAPARSIKRREIWRNGLMVKRIRGRYPKYCDDFAVEHFRNPGRAVEQFLRGFGVELRIFAQVISGMPGTRL